MPQRIKKSSKLHLALSKKRKLIQLEQDEKSDESQILSGNRVTNIPQFALHLSLCQYKKTKLRLRLRLE